MNSYCCDTCKASMSESSYIENQGICDNCFDNFLVEQKEIARIEKLIGEE